MGAFEVRSNRVRETAPAGAGTRTRGRPEAATIRRRPAEVAELADAPDSKSGSPRGVWVRFPPSASAGPGVRPWAHRSSTVINKDKTLGFARFHLPLAEGHPATHGYGVAVVGNDGTGVWLPKKSQTIRQPTSAVTTHTI